MTIFGIIMSVFHLIPGFTSLASNIVTTVYNSKVAITTARIGGDTAVAQSLVKAAVQQSFASNDRLKILAASKPLLFLVIGFALPYMIYEWQAIVYDKVIMHGATSTDPIKGNLADWGQTIITCIFGSGTALTLGHMYFNRKDS